MDPCAHESDDGVCGIMKTMAKEPLKVLALVGAMVMTSGCMIKPYVLTDEDVRTRAVNDLQMVSTSGSRCPVRSISMKPSRVH
jgi:hypothetical protein